MFRVSAIRTLVLAAVAGAALAGIAAPAGAAEIDAVADKLDRVERDLRDLQYEVYKGHPPATGTGVGAGPAVGAPVNAARLNDLEESLRDLRGQVETLAFQVRQLNEQLEFARKETNFRLGALEGGAPVSPAAAPEPSAQAAAPAAPRILAAPADAVAPPRTGGALGTIEASDVDAAAPALSPRQQYDAAMELLSRAQYVEAQGAFKAFVAANPKDALAGPAQFWVGEISFSQKDYKASAVAYADVVKRFAKTPKAPDAMLKLGLSLMELNQRKEACTTLNAVKTKFPTAPKPVLERAAKRFAEAKCAAG